MNTNMSSGRPQERQTLLNADELIAQITGQFPHAPRELQAAVLAEFLESVPVSVIHTDDGAVIDNSERLLAPDLHPEFQQWLDELKLMAGSAYPVDWAEARCYAR